MTMDMHMLGAMYAPTDNLTLMVMANYLDKEMDHVTYQGMAGTTVLGYFTAEAEGWSDTKVTGLYRLYDDRNTTTCISISGSACRPAASPSAAPCSPQ